MNYKLDPHNFNPETHLEVCLNKYEKEYKKWFPNKHLLEMYEIQINLAKILIRIEVINE